MRRTLLLLAIALLPASAVGQVGLAFEFSFSNPGARSLGFGGAFVALADDATAAFANPAGLVQLTRPEVSLEFRRWSYSTPFTEKGRFSGEPTGVGLDTISGIEKGRSENDLSGLSYLSVVYPKERWSIALYRHILANFEVDFETRGIFGEGAGPLDTVRLFERRDRTDLEIVTYGVSGAFRIVESLSLGLGVAYLTNSLDASQGIYLWDDDSLESYFGEVSFLPDRLLAESGTRTDDSAFALTGGLLWRLTDHWQVGGFFRQGPEFDLAFEIVWGPASMNPSQPPGSRSGIDTSMKYPDTYGAGVSYRGAGDRLTLSLEWDRIEYSSIFDSLGETASDEFINDGNEYRLGAEFAFLESKPLIAIRAGVWRDPSHQVESALDDIAIQALLAKGDDQMHYAVGVGAAFAKFQIDFGADFSDRRDILSISGIYGF